MFEMRSTLTYVGNPMSISKQVEKRPNQFKYEFKTIEKANTNQATGPKPYKQHNKNLYLHGYSLLPAFRLSLLYMQSQVRCKGSLFCLNRKGKIKARYEPSPLWYELEKPCCF